MTTKPRLLLVGCGHMGGALLHHWLKADVLTHVHVVKPSPLVSSYQNNPHLSWTSTPDQIPSHYNPDIVVLAVRPNTIDKITPLYATYRKCLFLSLAAGKNLDALTSLLSPEQPILRVMPNIASEIGKGMSFMVGNLHMTPVQKDHANHLFEIVGSTAWLPSENLFDVATTLSGCGPGYVFALVESMASAGERMGLPSDLSYKLAHQTLIGSAALLEQKNVTAKTLRQAIGNPGTMTEAAVKVLLSQEGLPDLMFKAMNEALKRAQELSR